MKLWFKTFKADPKEKYATSFPWRVSIINEVTGEVVYEVPKACATESHARRYALRYIKRYEKNGDFEKPLGIQASTGE